VIKTKLAEICRMEEYITLILHHSGDLVRNENQRLQYFSFNLCVLAFLVYFLHICFKDQFDI